MGNIKIDIKDPEVQKMMLFAAVAVVGIIIIGYVVIGNNGGNNIVDNGTSGHGNNSTNGYEGHEGKVQKNKDNATKISGKEIRFIVVGDPHVKSSNTGSDRGNTRLEQIVNFADSSNVDFVVFLGDIADDGKVKTYDIAKKILKNSTKPYYTIAGNHDVQSGPGNFEAYFGPMEHLENVKGYQLVFPGIYFEGKTKLHWSFDFNKVNKSMPTLVFMHGPTVLPPKDATSCSWGKDFFGYGQSMQSELDKLPGFVAEYTGHVHYSTDQTINGVRYVTVNGLVDKAGGCDNEGPSDYVGYSRVNNGKADYMLVDYNGPFEDPFPEK